MKIARCLISASIGLLASGAAEALTGGQAKAIKNITYAMAFAKGCPSMQVNEPLANVVLTTLKIDAMKPEHAGEFIRHQNEVIRDMAGMPQQEICGFGDALNGQSGTQVPTLLAPR